jgi:GLPGLI family protein
MKYKYIKILIVIILYPVFLISQNNNNGYVIYESGINGSKMDDYIQNKRGKIKSKKLVENLDKIFFNTKKIESKLFFSNNKGFFKVEEKLVIDENDLAQKISKILSGDSKEYYFNNKSKTYLIKDCATLGECFIYENPYLEWELTQETKKINGYMAYKATRNKGKTIAWYTPSIPVSFGPKGEYGLPGLILQLEVGKIIFKASKIVLNPKEKIVIKEPKGGKRVSYEEYAKEIKIAKKRVFGN